MARPSSGLTNRDLGIQGGGAGKGDKSRSPNSPQWRKNYDDIDWGWNHLLGSGYSFRHFKRVNGKWVKRYGSAETKGERGPHIVVR